jgi:hypothetical protein
MTTRKRRRRRPRLRTKDGLPQRKRRPPRKRECDKDTRSFEQDFDLILATPEAFRIYDDVDLHPPQGGKPPDYPPELYSLLQSLTFRQTGDRELVREVLRPQWRRERIADAVLANMRPDLPQRMFAKMRAMRESSDHAPHRTTVGRYLDAHGDPEHLHDYMLNIGVSVCLAAGRFDPGRADLLGAPDLTEAFIGDGTVFGAASDFAADELNPEGLAVDPKTGEIWAPRIDPTASTYTEGGDDHAIVYGTKFVMVIGSDTVYDGDVYLGVGHSASPAPAIEADHAAELMVKAAAALRDANRQSSAVLYDGAMTRKHAEKLIEHEMLLVNYPPPKEVNDDGTRAAEHKGHLGRHFHKTHHDCPGHTLVAMKGRAHLLEIIDGAESYTPLPHVPTVRRRHGHRYLYERITTPCRVNGTNTDILLPWHQGRGESVESHQQRVRYLRAWGAEPGGGTLARGLRSKIESKFSRWDARNPGGRLQAYSLRSKLRRVIGSCIAMNLVQLALARQRALGLPRAA